nr:immunoglobulin heavy chain junction region [Macaca mulatta]MOW75213.1 immunoglobulin heavy chain junction region [Macaca mulatta]MOW75761.1 immunoglobulin heavy chain junction region [Macaca mulatta]MOW75821.1 immunoglobulin heavy chain junction region [Macaca mulatta]MOW76186.1 immunoglobulin heavy chain junction region [Macaca mulatta]
CAGAISGTWLYWYFYIW